ncbi:O-antigen ligase family protein [Novosphingobium sp. YJ-S2-02]|uniref:O-antigen ligase family protein n=2 Tax=Novosphingobium aureum TaxID=2792964 RepID=A0A931HDA4_9SPHN|nr:O-antigen ligase family protein [Novosphingobium aureum]
MSPVLSGAVAFGCVAMLQFGGGNDYLSAILAALVSMAAGIVALVSTRSAESWLVAARPTLATCLAMLLLLVCWHVLRVDRQFDTTAFKLEVSLRIGLISVFTTGMVLARNRRAMEVLCMCLVVMGALWVGAELVAWMVEIDRLPQASPGRSEKPMRFVGTLGNPNVMGCVLAIFLAMTLAELLALAGSRTEARFRAREWVIGAGLIVSLQIFLAGLLVSQSRMAMVSGAVAAVGLCVWRRQDIAHFPTRYRHAALVLGAVNLVPGLALWFAIGDRLVPRLARLSDDLSGRIELLEYGLHLSFQRPLFGSGPGTFRQVNEAELTSQIADHYWNLGAAHNLVIGAAIEEGWIYVALAVFACGCYMRLLIQRSRVQSFTAREGGMLAAGLVGISCAMFDIALDFYAVAALEALLLGVMAGRASQAVSHHRAGHRALRGSGY